MKEVSIYSEKLGKAVNVSNEVSDKNLKVIVESADSSMVGWTHKGWNNDNGGGSW